MQNIENDMDTLFRKAVDQAPLIPATSRWDEISGKLSGNSTPSVAKEKINSFKKISGVFGYLLAGAITLTILTTFIKHHEIISPDKTAKRIGNPMNEKALISTMRIQDIELKDINLFRVKKKTSVISYLKNENKTNFLSDPINAEEGKLNGGLSLNMNNIENINLFQNHKSIELTDSLNNSHNSSLVKLNSFHNSRFYLGLIGGPQLSQIKHQGLTKPGFDMGLLIGYRINKKISVETGFLFTKQYYFVGGKYYNSVTGVNTVNSMEGSRTAFEIPFKLNYYLLQKKSGGFFISAGVSTYVGVIDKILINVGENHQPPPQKLDYGVASYLPSYLNFSLGYDYKFGKSTRFRLEPYLEIPMSSTAGNTININEGGALQVFNAGLHLVITEFIH
jgi:hypothetical protein